MRGIKVIFSALKSHFIASFYPTPFFQYMSRRHLYGDEAYITNSHSDGECI